MSNRQGSAVVTLPSDTEILITRQFDAPAALVWEALTRPEHIKRWWGPEWCPVTSFPPRWTSASAARGDTSAG